MVSRFFVWICLRRSFTNCHWFEFQHGRGLKSSQREKAREFVQLTQTGEKTALFCLQNHDWKLDMALDSYFANPELYCREPKISVDRKKLDHVYSKYKGKNLWSTTKSRFLKGFKVKLSIKLYQNQDWLKQMKYFE